MAQADGSGDYGFTPEEFTALAKQMLEAAEAARPGELFTISMGQSSSGVLNVNIRAPRERGPIEKLVFNLRPLYTSIL